MLLAKDVRDITVLSPETKDVAPMNVIKHEQWNPWWVAKEVCAVLGLTNPSITVQSLDDDERAKFNLGRQGDAWIVNEPGLYSLILRSRKPAAKQFKRWITHEILPQIRQTGGYIPIGEGRFLGRG